jgi:hypothetical protein
MDTAALRLLSRFSLGPNQLGYCGRNTATGKLKHCVVKGDTLGVARELEKFIVLHPYLQTIASVAGKSKFSYSVAEAFWLGNSELEKAKPEHYDKLLGYFRAQGVPEWLVAELERKRPKKFIPLHLFQILHVGVGRASGSVPFNLESINNCMVRWGRVLTLNRKNKMVRVKLNSLAKGKTGRYRLITKTEEPRYVPGFVPGMKTGDPIAVHWGLVTKVLTATEVRNLEKWTKRVLDAVG